MVLDALSFLKFSRQKNIISNAREELEDEKRKKNVIYQYTCIYVMIYQAVNVQ